MPNHQIGAIIAQQRLRHARREHAIVRNRVAFLDTSVPTADSDGTGIPSNPSSWPGLEKWLVP